MIGTKKKQKKQRNPVSAKSWRSRHTPRLKMRLDVEGLSLSQLPLLATPPAKQTPRRFHQISRVTLGTRRAIFCRRLLFFFFKQKTAYEIMPSLVGSEMCIRDRALSYSWAYIYLRKREEGRYSTTRFELPRVVGRQAISCCVANLVAGGRWREEE